MRRRQNADTASTLSTVRMSQTLPLSTADRHRADAVGSQVLDEIWTRAIRDICRRYGSGTLPQSDAHPNVYAVPFHTCDTLIAMIPNAWQPSRQRYSRVAPQKYRSHLLSTYARPRSRAAAPGKEIHRKHRSHDIATSTVTLNKPLRSSLAGDIRTLHCANE